MSKNEKYLMISKEITNCIGGEDNIQGVAHCATRLRIVLKDVSLVQKDKLENIELVKGVFTVGSQLQIIFGAGLVNDVYAVFSKYVGKENMSLEDVKTQVSAKQNPIQKLVKSLSDVFVDIIPAILAAALLMGLTGVLGKWDLVQDNATLYAINRLANLASTGIFAILPMVVCYSSTKRYGGRAILGMVVGAIMLDASLANAYSIGTEGFNPEVLSLFGLQIQMVGFQGGIIIALMMGWVVATLDKFFQRVIPDVVKLLFAPMLTVFISTILLFTIVGPAGRILADTITGSLIWMTENLGALGFALFAGLQQIVVITGIHHIIGAVESQLIATTGVNFINPLMSVALIGQAGAVLGYMALHWKNVKTRELCIPSFISTLFGISEPAIFGITLRYRFPLIAGCLGGAVAGVYVYFTKLVSLGFGTTAVPGIAIVDPSNNGYVNYIIAHIIGLGVAFILTVVFGKMMSKKEETNLITYPTKGEVKRIEECRDNTFAAKTLGDGIVIDSVDGLIVSPCKAKVEFVFPSKHAIGLRLENGAAILIHCGINTVELNGEGFETFVKVDDIVQTNDKLIQMDLDLLKEKGYDTQVITVITELPENTSMSIKETTSTWFNFN